MPARFTPHCWHIHVILDVVTHKRGDILLGVWQGEQVLLSRSWKLRSMLRKISKNLILHVALPSLNLVSLAYFIFFLRFYLFIRQRERAGTCTSRGSGRKREKRPCTEQRAHGGAPSQDLGTLT